MKRGLILIFGILLITGSYILKNCYIIIPEAETEKFLSLNLPTCATCDGYKGYLHLRLPKKIKQNNSYSIGFSFDTLYQSDIAQVKENFKLKLDDANLRITEPNPIEYKKNTKFPYEFKWIVSANDLGSKKMKISSTNSDFLKNFFKDEKGVPNDIIDDFFNQIDRNGYMTFDYEVVNPVGLCAKAVAGLHLMGFTGLIILTYIIGLFKKVIDFFKPRKKQLNLFV